MKKASVQIPATSANLGPGFDVLGVALKLYNRIFMEADSPWTSRRIVPSLTVEVSGEGAGSLPRNRSNLAVKAAYRVFDLLKQWPNGLHVRLVNHIPLSRGLGSSAAATLGGMAAANRLAGNRLSDQELLDLAVRMEGHPDNIVPAMMGGFCVSGLFHGKTYSMKLPAPAGLRAVVCSPEKALSTLQSRRVLPGRVAFAAAVFTSSRVAFFLGAIFQKRYDWLGFAMDDVLHQPARARLIPGLLDVIGAARKAGAWGCALSGAGSSVIALCPPGPKAGRVGAAMQKAFAARGIASRWSELLFDNAGLKARS
ncbi:MAG TPA: homoserine kinase [Elusimicrobiota bacterium]|nr:homoserine kinase [Elusimicrobiota bacterium]